MHDLRIEDLERTLEDLPLLPSVVTSLIGLDRDKTDHFEQILHLAEADATLALRIIRLSNNSASAPSTTIATLPEALTRVGSNAIESLVKTLSVMKVFLPTTPAEKNLWIHAVQVAVTARFISRYVPKLKIGPDTAYLCGLLHDIGRFVLFDRAPVQLNLVESSPLNSPRELITEESKVYGFNHADLGAKLCKTWGLPKIIVAATLYHHDSNVSKLSAVSAELGNLISIIQIADSFSFLAMSDPALLASPAKELNGQLQTHCISPCSTPPLTAIQLAKLIPLIIKESAARLDSLKL